MKTITCFVFCMLLAYAPLHVCAQNRDVDSITSLLNNFKRNKNFTEDTGYINTLNTLGFKLFASNPDTAVLLGVEAIALCEKINYKKGKAEALKNRGLVYNLKGAYDSALSIYAAGLKIATDNGYTDVAGRLYHNSAITYTNLGKYPEALENYFKALKMREQIGEKLGISSSTNGIGTVYFLEGKYDEALVYFTKAMQISEEINYKPGIEAGYANAGEIYFTKGDYDNAQKNLQRSLDVSKETGNVETAAYVKVLLGYIFIKKGKNEEALATFRDAEEMAKKISSREQQCRSLMGIGSVYIKYHKTDSALHYAQQGLQMAQNINFLELIRDGNELLSEVYEAKGDGMKALQYAKAFKQYADSINNRQTQQSTANMAAEYEYSKKELLLKADFDKKSATQNWIIFSAFAALLSALVVVWLVYRSRQKEKKANLLLQQKNIEIDKQKTNLEKAFADLKSAQTQLIQSEKMASLGELTAGIAHEIQNPLNFVNNFSDVSTELIDEMIEEMDKGNPDDAKDIAGDVKENLKKILHHGRRADGIIKGMLQHSRVSNGQKEPTDINTLADEYLKLAYHGYRAKDKTFMSKFGTDFDASIGKINIVAQDIGRVILNLLNNAFYSVTEKKKKAAPDYEPEVSISTRKINGKIEIRVKDNGTGIPQNIVEKIFQPFFTTKPTGQGTGLGLSLSYDIITKGHGGEIKTETEEGKGAVFIFTLPVA